MDIILITTGERQDLIAQTCSSMYHNAANWSDHTLTVVVDSDGQGSHLPMDDFRPTSIFNSSRQGASASRNIGAGSIPKYRRQEHVMFCDDDCYFTANWDEKLLELDEELLDISIISGHGHPFNGSELMVLPKNPPTGYQGPRMRYREPLVISSVCMFMRWELFDDVGYFCEPGGPGGSEDYDYCMRAKKELYGFAITEPQCVIHCGLTSSSGKQIVGYDEMVKQNEALIALHGLTDIIWK